MDVFSIEFQIIFSGFILISNRFFKNINFLVDFLDNHNQVSQLINGKNIRKNVKQTKIDCFYH